MEREKKLTFAIEKLHKFEMRALNLFRDVELVHIQKMIDEQEIGDRPDTPEILHSERLEL